MNSLKHDSAMKYTSGVIGNSYYAPEYIGMSKVDPAVGQWNPIDGYKRTHTGVLESHYIRRTDGHGDDDVNLYINPNDSDPNLVRYLQAHGAMNRLRDPHFSINSEIDVPDAQKKYFYPYLPHIPIVSYDIINAYGPFVHDVVDNSVTDLFGDDHNYIEIHPSEQIWWTNTLNTGLGISDEYNLLLMSDNSGRYTNGRWQKTPLSGVFAIAFTVNPAKSRLRYNIEIANQYNVSQRSTDGKKHFFKYGGRNLIEVNEPAGMDILDISFGQPFIQKNNNDKSDRISDTLVKGFLLVKSQVGLAGNLIFKITSNTLNANWGFNGVPGIETYSQIKVTLDQIKCIRENDGGSEDLYGYVGCGVYDTTYKIPQTRFKPVEAINPEKGNLLWYSLDDDNSHTANSIISLRSGQSKIFNESRLFVIKKTGYIKLFADLNEDDGGYEDNKTTPDGNPSVLTDPVDAIQSWVTSEDPDDLLEKYCKDCGGPAIAVQLLQLNVPVRKVLKFGSGGSELEVHLTVVKVR
ncbi:MAG: hypothetical protein ABIR30_06140 [Chitinophagaceae bacterium]